jgi:hypothetical protein
MKFIQLSQGQLSSVDDDVFEELNQHRWHFGKGGYAYRCRRINGKNCAFQLHSAILPKKEGLEIDHINRNKLDNRLENLRYATHGQNMANRSIGKNNTSGFKGVFKNGSGWIARIFQNGKFLNLGTYSTRREAAITYNLTASTLFGHFALLNDIQENDAKN